VCLKQLEAKKKQSVDLCALVSFAHTLVDDSCTLPTPTSIDESTARVIVADVGRTFLSQTHRDYLQRLLESLVEYGLDGHYHQSLSLICGLLLLYFDWRIVFVFIYVLNHSAKYMRGYWRSEAVGFATDAYVFSEFLETFDADLAHHLINKAFALPETYAQKWFIGWCINVFEFDQLFSFIEAFLNDGFVFLQRFALSFVVHYRTHLLAASTSLVFAILRLDRSKSKECAQIADNALHDDIIKYAADPSHFEKLFAAYTCQKDWDTQRAACYERHLRKRMEGAAAVAGKAQASDSDSSLSWDSDASDDDEGCCMGAQDCEMMGEYFCKEKSLLVCSDCKKKYPSLTFEEMENLDYQEVVDQIKTASLVSGMEKLEI